MAALLNITITIRFVCSHDRVSLTVWNLLPFLLQPLHTNHKHREAFFWWPLQQWIQMKEFGHLIHSHPLFILLRGSGGGGRNTGAPLLRERPTKTNLFLWAKEMPCSRRASHQDRREEWRRWKDKEGETEVEESASTRSEVNHQADAKSNYYHSEKGK